MNIADRLTLEIGKAALAKMTLAQALETGYDIGYGEGYGDGKQHAAACRSQSAKFDTQADLPRTDDAQPVGGDIIAERMDKPALSAILPRRPDDVPAPVEGWDYVSVDGSGLRLDDEKASEHIAVYYRGMWDYENWQGIERNVAICRTAPPDIWHRFGLLAPSEGGGFYPHTPGDPCPCEGDMRVEVVLSGESPGYIDFSVCHGRDWAWGRGGDIIGWRPAMGGAK